MMAMVPLMIVPLLVWVAVWGYLWALDLKIGRMRRELDRLRAAADEAPAPSPVLSEKS